MRFGRTDDLSIVRICGNNTPLHMPGAPCTAGCTCVTEPIRVAYYWGSSFSPKEAAMSARDEAPPRRNYYSVRSGKRPPGEGFSLVDFKRFFQAAFDRLWEDGLFQQWFGYTCVDAGDVEGKAGKDINLFVFRKLRTMELWPVWDKLGAYSEEDLFDMIEFLHDHSSKGIDGAYHQYELAPEKRIPC
jgi:hypothetical protein